MRAMLATALAAAAVTATLVAVGARATDGGPPRAPRVHHVAIRAMAFVPSTITVDVGDTVVWTNEDLFAHTVTAAGFDSGEMKPQATWRWRAAKGGDHAYVCTYHPTMRGVVATRD